MVILAPVRQSEVVEGGDDVDHVGVQCRKVCGQPEALPDYHTHMVLAVRLVKGSVVRNYLPFNVVCDFLCHGHRWLFHCRAMYFYICSAKLMHFIQIGLFSKHLPV